MSSPGSLKMVERGRRGESCAVTTGERAEGGGIVGLEAGGRGCDPRDVGGLQDLEKATSGLSFSTNTALLAP